MAMRLCAAALIGLIGSVDALRPMLSRPSSLVCRRHEGCSHSKLLFKVADADEAVAVDEEIDFQQMDDSASVLQKLSKGFVPLAASIGFAMTPSPVMARRLVGAAAGGIVGLVAKSLLSSMARGDPEQEPSDGGGGAGVFLPSTETVVATMEKLKQGPPIASLEKRQIEQAAKQKGVAAADLSELYTCVFAEVLFAAITTDSEDLTELSEVTDFAKLKDLSAAEIGDGFSLAATRLAELLEKDPRGLYSPAFPAQVLLATAKAFFLADKMIGSSGGFYGKRFAVAVSFFTAASLNEVVSSVSTSLFQRCVRSVLANPVAFSQLEVQNLKTFLSASPGVSALRPASMQNIVMEFLQSSVDLSLKANRATALTARVSNMDALQQAQDVMGWNTREFSATVETRTMPVFEEAARQLVDQAMLEPEQASELAGVLRERVTALNVDERKARVALTTIISERNAEYMFKMEKVYNASGGAVEPVFKIMSAYADSHAALKTLAEGVMDGVGIPVPGLPFAEMVRVSLFELQDRVKDASVTNDMFSLNEAQQRIVRKNMAMPKLASWIGQCISEGNFEEPAKLAYQKLCKDNGVSESEWRATSIDFYYQDAQRIASARAVPTESDMLRLEALRTFLDCPEEAVAQVNLELLGDKYAKALVEAMTPSGVITEEYESGLERLRLRLGLRKSDAENLLSLVTRKDKLAPLVRDLASQWKSDTDANKREVARKDKSSDRISSQDNVLGFMETGAQKTGGGPNVFMREALNFIELSVENFQGQGVDISNNPPVTAVGVLPEADLVGVFKHYLITELSEQDEELRARYFGNERMFGLLLGIDAGDQMKVKESLAYTAYKSMLKGVMRYKDAVGADELRQFAVLKDSLGLGQETADRIYNECAKGAVIETAAAIMRAKDGEVSADTARRLRSQVQSLGLDMQRDTGFNEKFVAYLYSLEVQYLIENDMSEELREVQEAYDIPEERASDIIEVSCRRFVSQIMNFALRAAKKYDEREAVRVGRQILKYSQFISDRVDADGAMFREADKDRLVSFLHDEMGAKATAEDRLALAWLKEKVHLTEDYVAPLKGIEGLEGKIGKAPEYDDDKKKWSWG